jgi:hypothetical protein
MTALDLRAIRRAGEAESVDRLVAAVLGRVEGDACLTPEEDAAEAFLDGVVGALYGGRRWAMAAILAMVALGTAGAASWAPAFPSGPAHGVLRATGADPHVSPIWVLASAAGITPQDDTVPGQAGVATSMDALVWALQAGSAGRTGEIGGPRLREEGNGE